MDRYQLFWSSRSPFVRKVLVFAHEAGVADRLDLVPMTASARAPDPGILAVSPANRIPALVGPDGAVVLDSHFICEFLESQGDGLRLMPAGPNRWEMAARAATASALLDNLVNWLRERSRPEDAASVQYRAAYRQKLSSCLDALAASVPAADPARFDYGDITVAVALAYVDFRFSDTGWRDDHPALAAWLDRVAQRASMRATEFSD